jgi:HpcH/HpaI aldolase/citrate lyase family
VVFVVLREAAYQSRAKGLLSTSAIVNWKGDKTFLLPRKGMAATLLLGWLLISFHSNPMRGSHQFLERAGGISSTRPEKMVLVSIFQNPYRYPFLMPYTAFPNTFRRKVLAGERLIGCWCSLANPISTEILGIAGFDWLLFDAEHSPNDVLTLIPQLMALKDSPSAPVVRPPANDAPFSSEWKLQ